MTDFFRRDSGTNHCDHCFRWTVKPSIVKYVPGQVPPKPLERPNLAHMRQSRPDSGRCLLVKVLIPCKCAPCLLGSGKDSLWGYNPVCKVTPVILPGVVSPLRSSDTGLHPQTHRRREEPPRGARTHPPQSRAPPHPTPRAASSLGIVYKTNQM